MPDKPAYIKDLIPDNRRRAPWHDYCSRSIYMITANKAAGASEFGVLADFENPSDARIELTRAGKIIEEEIASIPMHNSAVKVLCQTMMPDHFHALLFVTEAIDRPLGAIVQATKASATRRIRELLGRPDADVFEPGFHDRIITRSGQLEAVKNYILQNPCRLAVRKALPDYFRRVNSITIAGRQVKAYGNMHLLDSPFKQQVVVHRADSPEVLEEKRQAWLYSCANGGVLVSPFISKAERAIREEAEAAGGRLILFTAEPMPERYKPFGHDFELCAEGHLLVISPLDISAGRTRSTPLTRADCLAMNKLAEELASGNFSR